MDFTFFDIRKLYKLFRFTDSEGNVKSENIKGGISGLLGDKLSYIIDNLTLDQVKSLVELVKVFDPDTFSEDIQSGEGASVWTDDNGKINLVVDYITSRETVSSKETELSTIFAPGGTIQIAPKSKSIKINRR